MWRTSVSITVWLHMWAFMSGFSSVRRTCLNSVMKWPLDGSIWNTSHASNMMSYDQNPWPNEPKRQRQNMKHWRGNTSKTPKLLFICDYIMIPDIFPSASVISDYGKPILLLQYHHHQVTFLLSQTKFFFRRTWVERWSNHYSMCAPWWPWCIHLSVGSLLSLSRSASSWRFSFPSLSSSIYLSSDSPVFWGFPVCSVPHLVALRPVTAAHIPQNTTSSALGHWKLQQNEDWSNCTADE